MGPMRIRLLWRERVLIGLLVGSGVLLALLSDVFFTPANLLRATRYAAEIGLVALPMTMIIISRGIDLSVASNMALSAMTMGLLWQRGVPVWPAAALGIAAGRYIYGIGHNETALRFSGIDVDRIVLGLYTASGFVSALAGMIYAARVGTAKSNAAAGYELTVITAVVLGGTSLTGGEGTILGTMLGVLIITILQNGLTLARVPAAVQDVLIGTVLVGAVLTYRERAGRKEVFVIAPPQPEPHHAGGRVLTDPGNDLAVGEERRNP